MDTATPAAPSSPDTVLEPVVPTAPLGQSLRTFAMWLVAVAVIVAGAAASLPDGPPVRVGTSRLVVVTGAADGPWRRPETTPWIALGVTDHQPVHFEALGRLVNGTEYRSPHSAGPAVGDLAAAVEEARREASRLMGRVVVGDVHVGSGRGNSVGLLASLALIGSSGAADPAGCGRPAGCLRVAATGEVSGSADSDVVRLIGGLELKLEAAADAGADVVFHPAMNLDDPTSVPFGKPSHFARLGADWDRTPTAVPVWTVRDALGWLCGATGDRPTCELAGVTTP